MKREDIIYYGKNIKDAKGFYLKEISFYLDITNYLLFNYENFLSYEENLTLIKNIKKVNKLLVILQNTLNEKKTDMIKINYIMYLFNKVVSHTDNISFKVFKDELTKIEDYYPGRNFNFLVHTITSGNNRITNNSEITSASLINEENIALFSNSNSDNTYGYILDCDLDNIVVSCDADAFSDIQLESEKKKISNRFDKYFNYNDFQVKISPINVNGIAKIAKIIPINYLKRINVDECICMNSEKLNYDNFEIYNEIVLLNNEKLVKKGIFVRTLGDRSINQNYKEALELSKKTNLPLVEIDLSLYREKNNMDTLTVEEKAKIIKKFKNIIEFDNDIFFSYYFSNKHNNFSKECLDIYEDLRKKKYLDEEELKDYLVDRFENYKIRVKK